MQDLATWSLSARSAVRGPAAGFGSVRFWLANVVLVQLSVLYVWLTNGAGGNILIVVLAHAGFNIAGERVPCSTTGDVVAVLAVTAGTLVVIVATRGWLWSRRPDHPRSN